MTWIASFTALTRPAEPSPRSCRARRLHRIIGAGPCFAVAEYGAAKVLEAAGGHALAAELEEWTHLNYFDAVPEEIATLVTIPRGSRAEGRGLELLAYMTKLGRLLAVVGSGVVAEAARRHGHAVLDVDGDVPEPWSPLLLSAPHALLAAHLAELTGADYGRGAKGRWDDAADASTVPKERDLDGRPMTVSRHEIETAANGAYDITATVREAALASQVSEGLCVVFVPHTAAGVSITSFWDPKGLEDIHDDLNRLVSDPHRLQAPVRHAARRRRARQVGARRGQPDADHRRGEARPRALPGHLFQRVRRTAPASILRQVQPWLRAATSSSGASSSTT